VDQERAARVPSGIEKSADQVRWDYNAETIGFLSKMIKVLKERFGEANQSDKYRLELQSRVRLPNETFRNLHSDIRRLATLALPQLDHGARKAMARALTSSSLSPASSYELPLPLLPLTNRPAQLMHDPR